MVEMDAVPAEARMIAGVSDAFALADADRMAYLDDQIARYCYCQLCGKNLAFGHENGCCAACRNRAQTAAGRMIRLVMQLPPAPTRAAPEPAPAPARLLARIRPAAQRCSRCRKRPPRPGLRTCQKCADTVSANQKRAG